MNTNTNKTTTVTVSTRTMKLDTRSTRAFDELRKIGAPVYRGEERDEFAPLFEISAEQNSVEVVWADYWMGFFVNPEIRTVIEKYGLHIEWNDASSMAIYDA
jgi:hypothetical protein